jgi:hypothetical protein
LDQCCGPREPPVKIPFGEHQMTAAHRIRGWKGFQLYLSSKGEGFQADGRSVPNNPATYDRGDKSKFKVDKGEIDELTRNENRPPEAEMEPRRGTAGTIFARRNSLIFSINSHLTPEWPRTREFMRISMAPRIQASGMVVELPGSRSGRMLGASWEEGRMPSHRVQRHRVRRGQFLTCMLMLQQSVSEKYGFIRSCVGYSGSSPMIEEL